MNDIATIIGWITVTIIFAGTVVMLMARLHFIRVAKGKAAPFTAPFLLVLFERFDPLFQKTDSDNRLAQAYVDMCNQLDAHRFSNTPMRQRLIFLPGCLRHPECVAPLSPLNGIQCSHCHKCGIGNYLTTAERRHLSVFIVPGSSFIKRLIRHYNPRAILGVGCLMEITEGMYMARKAKLCAQTIPLTTDGCIHTAVDWSQIKRVSLGCEQNIAATPSTVPPALHPPTEFREAGNPAPKK